MPLVRTRTAHAFLEATHRVSLSLRFTSLCSGPHSRRREKDSGLRPRRIPPILLSSMFVRKTVRTPRCPPAARSASSLRTHTAGRGKGRSVCAWEDSKTRPRHAEAGGCHLFPKGRPPVGAGRSPVGVPVPLDPAEEASASARQVRAAGAAVTVRRQSGWVRRRGRAAPGRGAGV